MFALCHQIPHRSFLWLWDPPWLCARCTGFYFAILVALVLFAIRPHWGRTRWFRITAAGVLAAAAIGLEKFLDFDLGNWGRSVLAMPLGFAVGLGLAMPFLSRKSQEELK
jgi:uncharacterized membrane protein